MSRFLYSLIAGFIPSFLLLLYIWQKDHIRRKPIKELCRALGLGVLAVFLSKAITSLYTIEKGCTIWEMTCFSFLKTAIPEEIAKFIIFWLFVRKNKYFDDRMDGITYASCVSLGFAGVENLLYILTCENLVTTTIARSLVSTPGHFFYGVMMGYYYSLIRLEHNTPKINYILVLLVPILLHGVYNSTVFSSNVCGESCWPLMVLMGLLVLTYSCKLASKSISRHQEAAAQTIAAEVFPQQGKDE